MIAAAATPAAARAVVDEADATLAQADFCEFCTIMYEVPAAVACARTGDLDKARRHLAVAERSAMLWAGTAWQAATMEARSHLLEAEGDVEGGRAMRRRAAELFDAADHPLDAARCRAT
jgi:hypothetical protein